MTELSSGSSFVTTLLWDFGQILCPLWVLVFPLVKRRSWYQDSPDGCCEIAEMRGLGQEGEEWPEAPSQKRTQTATSAPLLALPFVYHPGTDIYK
jgi:hypothetical protein